MIYISYYTKDFPVSYHVMYALLNFKLTVLKNSDKRELPNDINKSLEDLEDLDSFKKYDYNYFRKLINNYNVNINYLENEMIEIINNKHRVILIKYSDFNIYKKQELKHCKNIAKTLDKNSDNYKIIKELFYKIKECTTVEQIIEEIYNSQVLNRDEEDIKVFYDFEDYIQYIFDSQ